MTVDRIEGCRMGLEIAGANEIEVLPGSRSVSLKNSRCCGGGGMVNHLGVAADGEVSCHQWQCSCYVAPDQVLRTKGNVRLHPDSDTQGDPVTSS